MSDAQIAWQPGATCRHPATPYGHATRPAAARAACAATATARRPQPAPSQPAVRPRSAAPAAHHPRARVHRSRAHGRCPGASPRRRARPRQGSPKAGGGDARSACVARCPLPCVTTYLTWPSRLRACACRCAAAGPSSRSSSRRTATLSSTWTRRPSRMPSERRPQRPARSTRPGSCGAAFTEPGTQRGHKYWWFRGPRSVAVCFCCKACVCHFCPVHDI